MTVNPLPPQAYTKDTLQKAYAWLLAQPASVKEMAHDQNILVSLYLKAQRNGDAVLETPSIQNFKHELKSLASMMGDFSSQQPPAPVQQTTIPQGVSSSVSSQAMTTQAAPSQSMLSKPDNKGVDTLALDSKTVEAIHAVRESLNLGSDVEALRALVSLGFKQFRKTGL